MYYLLLWMTEITQFNQLTENEKEVINIEPFGYTLQLGDMTIKIESRSNSFDYVPLWWLSFCWYFFLFPTNAHCVNCELLEVANSIRYIELHVRADKNQNYNLGIQSIIFFGIAPSSSLH